MSCIEVRVKVLAFSVAASVSNVVEQVPAEIIDMSRHQSATCHDVADHLTGICSYTSYDINLNVKQICSVSIGKYIKVDKNTVWVTPDVWEQIQVMSNTDWEIV